MFNYEVNIDNRHNVKLSASTPEKIARLLWTQTLAQDMDMSHIDYKDIEDAVSTLGLPEELLVWTYYTEDDCEEFVIDTNVVDTEEKLNLFVDFIRTVHPIVHNSQRLEILKIDNVNTCIIS